MSHLFLIDKHSNMEDKKRKREDHGDEEEEERKAKVLKSTDDTSGECLPNEIWSQILSTLDRDNRIIALAMFRDVSERFSGISVENERVMNRELKEISKGLKEAKGELKKLTESVQNFAKGSEERLRALESTRGDRERLVRKIEDLKRRTLPNYDVDKWKSPSQYQSVLDDQEPGLAAVRLDDVKMLEFVPSLGWYVNDDYNLIAAIENNSPKCFKYIVDEGLIYHWERAFTRAVQLGRLDCLKYMHENPQKWKDDSRYKQKWLANICEVAAKYGRLECLKYLYENGARMTGDVCLYACNRADEEMLEYVHANGCPCDCIGMMMTHE